jgi:FMN phosphatase YigB (HAD superfamily)
MLLERARIAPAEAAHVGDDQEADVEGARGAGVLPVWLNRAGTHWERESPPPPITIRTLDELPHALEPHAR